MGKLILTLIYIFFLNIVFKPETLHACLKEFIHLPFKELR